MGRWSGRRVAVLFGGVSAEREISLQSGRKVAQALRRRGYSVAEIDAAASLPLRLREERAEVAFIALHGKLGEDGAVQGLLEVLRIPYTGCGVLGSALRSNKIVSKHLWRSAGLPVAQGWVVRRSGAPPRGLKPPLVVKPSSEGSSVGVSIVRAMRDLPQALARAWTYDPEALVERYVAGREVTVAIVGGRPLGAMELRAKKGDFMSFEVKYTPGLEEFRMPAPLPPRVYRRTLDTALEAARVLGCEAFARIDFRVDRRGTPYLLELNSIPGLTDLSWLPRIARHAGLSYEDLVEQVLEEASLKIEPHPRVTR